MKDVYQTSMTDLYSTTSFGGGGSSGGSGRGGRATLGPGGGSDPGNHQSARTGNGLGTGPLNQNQQRVADLAVNTTLGAIGGGPRGAVGAAIATGVSWARY